LGCYNLTLDTVTSSAYAVPAARVIARVFPDFSVDTSLFVTDAFVGGSTVLSSVASMDGSVATGFYLSGAQFQSSAAASPSPAPEGGSAGIRFLTGTAGTHTTIPLWSGLPVNALALSAGSLFVAKPYLVQGTGNAL
jgi:hypothetical protein